MILKNIQLSKTVSACALLVAAIHSLAIAQSQNASLILDEMWITSIRGSVTDAFSMDPKSDIKNSIKNRMQAVSGPNGTAYAPFHIKAGKRLYINQDSHALISFPGAGHAMIVGDCTSIQLAGSGGQKMTIGFNAHPQSPAKGFFNISASEMAKYPGKVFSMTTKSQSNSADDKALSISYAQTLISTRGARFFVIDELTVGVGAGVNEKYGNGCSVGVFDGTVTIKETVAGKEVEVKPGQVVIVKPHEITPPRLMTKAEVSYDIGCKLAALGREVPAKLPPSMKTSPKNLPGTKINSLGMTFVPVPKTNVYMCVHETRLADYAAFLAAEPASEASKANRREFGYWGWEDYPVAVNWDSAQAFCEWLSRKEGKKYRLPTDEEWSHAAGIGSKENRRAESQPSDLSKKAVKGYPWGTEWPPKGQGNFGDISREAEFAPSGRAMDGSPASPDLLAIDDGYIEAAPVMSFSPNKLGIYDLGGNLSEWCDDWFDGTRAGRVVRGGSYYDDYESSLLAVTRASRATGSTFDTGFRIVLEVH
jgi:formylglycine-generating enzyme required for sulfatase activity